MASPIELMEEFGEGVTPLLTATFEDETGTPIPGTSLDSVTMTVREKDSRMIINGREDFDLSPFVSVLGVLSFRLASADMDHVTANTTEYHDFIISWDYDTTGHGIKVIRVPIVDIPSV